MSRWFGEHVEGSGPFVWDTYLLYGPDARWETTPGPLLGRGRTVMAKRQDLDAQIGPLLAP
ncbi:MAG: hypothetical protein AB7U18_11540 [Dehalococcoidia bacterium]